MQHERALLLGAVFVGMGTVTAINEIGIGLYPKVPRGYVSVYKPIRVEKAVIASKSLSTLRERQRANQYQPWAASWGSAMRMAVVDRRPHASD
jgi:hypothetical protein